VNLLVLLVLPALVGTAVGLATGGSLRNLGSARFRGVVLLWLAAGVQAVQLITSWGLLLGAIFALVAGWIAVNLGGATRPGRTGLVLVLLGLVLNGTAIALNGRMPYSPRAAVLVGFAGTGETAKNVPAGPTTRAGWLGDVIPVAALDAVVSVGDIVISAGTVLLLIAMTHGRVREGVKNVDLDP
jgi:hypothetical protein